MRGRKGFGRSLWDILNCELLILMWLMDSGTKALREQQKDEMDVERLTDVQEKRTSELDSASGSGVAP